MALSPSAIDDIVKSTLANLGRFRWTDISLDLQEYCAFTKLVNKNRVTFQSGESIDMNIKTVQGNQARWTGLYDTDNVNVVNLLSKANIPWLMADTHFGYDVREPAFNRGAAEIVNLLRVRRADAMNACAKLFEDAFWGTPDTTDNKKIYGVGYWFPKSTTQGFNGGNPSGFTNVAGLDSDTYPNWKSYTDGYTSVTKTDYMRKVRRAATMTRFIAPHAHPRYEQQQQRFGFYMPYATLGEIEEFLDTSNDRLGFDFGRYDGRAVFRGIPLVWVPKLDDDTNEPTFGIDWATFNPVIMRGFWMKQSDPRDTATGSHMTRAIYYDYMWNLRCVNRRRNFRVSK